MQFLTAKQRRFIDEYLVDGNGTAAAIRAGYGRSGARVAAHRTLRNANVAAEITARRQADADRLCIERQDVIAGLLEAVGHAREQRNPGAMIRAWSEVGKLMGYFAPQHQQVDVRARDGFADHVVRLEALSDAQLAAIVAGGDTY